MNAICPKIKKNFGFGFMRLPMDGDNVDIPAAMKMVDTFMERGFNYFDTAHGYIEGKSELALRECLTSRYPRESYVLTNKLTPGFYHSAEEIPGLCQAQLDACGVDFFDFYLIHALDAQYHRERMEMGAYEAAFRLKEQGKVRHIGMSFHDSAQVLDQILTDVPEMEVVQIQYNYADYEDPVVQSRACYEVCRKHGKPVIVMEPVKGGSLVNLPEEAVKMMVTGSPASYAIRFAASPEGMMMVLSGMSNQEQMEDNLSYMENFKPLTADERNTIDRVRTIYQAQHRIPCTACRYCTDGCPAGIPIPGIFAAANDFHEKKSRDTSVFALASNCIRCGQCESVCPQHLHIRDLLQSISAGSVAFNGNFC